MNQGIIDIGSNTIRLNVYQVENQSFKLLFSKKASVGLVSYVKKRIMSKEGIEVLANCLNQFVSMMNSLKINTYYAFATASLRNLDNTKEVIDTIKEKCNVSIDLLSGEKEGQLSFLGATHGLHNHSGIYMDSGGASSEIVVYEKDQIKFVTSIGLGSLNLFNKYVSSIIPSKEEYKKMKEVFLKELKEVNKDRKYFRDDTIAITGGSMRAIRAVLKSLNLIDSDSFEFSSELLEELEDYIFEDQNRAAHLILKIKPDRIHTFICGLAIIKTLADYTKAKAIQVSVNGLREGYLIEKIMGEDNDRKEI